MSRTTRLDRPTAAGRSAGSSWREIVKGVLVPILALLPQLPGTALADPAQIWFAPMDWFVRPWVGYGGSTDYMDLFQPQSADSALSKVAVFKVYVPFVQWAKDDDLRRVFTELKRRHIALAMETGVLTANERCGHGVEGYGGEDAAKVAARIARVGGDLAYIAMDEPIAGANVCHADL